MADCGACCQPLANEAGRLHVRLKTVQFFTEIVTKEISQLASVDAIDATRAEYCIAKVVKGQHRTLDATDDLDHLITMARVGGGNLGAFSKLLGCVGRRAR